MRLSGHEINSQLRQKLAMPTGRHLYIVLGTYERIERYERVAFREARGPDDRPLGPALNINLSLLQRFGDEELKWLVRHEAGMQETVKKQLADELDALVADKLMETSFLALKNLELLFAYDMELNCFRIRAVNQSSRLLTARKEVASSFSAIRASSSSASCFFTVSDMPASFRTSHFNSSSPNLCNTLLVPE